MKFYEPSRWLRLLAWLRPRCDSCGRWKRSFWRRQRTAYEDDRSNWFVGCEDCHEINDEHWDDM